MPQTGATMQLLARRRDVSDRGAVQQRLLRQRAGGASARAARTAARAAPRPTSPAQHLDEAAEHV